MENFRQSTNDYIFDNNISVKARTVKQSFFCKALNQNIHYKVSFQENKLNKVFEITSVNDEMVRFININTKVQGHCTVDQFNLQAEKGNIKLI